MLNSEADAFECFDYLLTAIHTWAQATTQQPPDASASVAP